MSTCVRTGTTFKRHKWFEGRCKRCQAWQDGKIYSPEESLLALQESVSREQEIPAAVLLTAQALDLKPEDLIERHEAEGGRFDKAT